MAFLAKISKSSPNSNENDF